MELEQIAAAIGTALERQGRRLATAESCTGGWVAREITAVAGSSAWFDRGFVTYSNQSKQDMLGVSPQTLQDHGAVSEQTVREMAEGALRRSQAQVALAISGVAGPGGGTPEKPVGTVWLAWAGDGLPTITRVCRYFGDREEVRRQAVADALQGILNLVDRTR